MGAAEGEYGDDVIIGGREGDRIWGWHEDAGPPYGPMGNDADVLKGGEGGDQIYGDGMVLDYGDNDFLYGGAGVDSLRGGAGHDRVDGGGGNDFLEGGLGADQIIGGRRKDQLWDNLHMTFDADRDILRGGRNWDRGGWGSNDDARGIEVKEK